MRRKEDASNLLKKIPARKDGLEWSQEEDGLVTLHIENKGVFNRIAQKIFKRPKISHIHLDAMGSFIWTIMDGKQDVIALGKDMEERFGEEANPVYERMVKYFQILNSYGFMTWNED